MSYTEDDLPDGLVTTMAPTTILVTSQSAPSRLRELAERFHADAIDPVQFKCLRCHCEWNRFPSLDYRDVTCSNCYSARVIITIVRLGFQNWGTHNGGKADQTARLHHAQRAFSKALKAIAVLSLLLLTSCASTRRVIFPVLPPYPHGPCDYRNWDTACCQPCDPPKGATDGK